MKFISCLLAAAAVWAGAVSVASASTTSRGLRQGSTGDMVLRLQQYLQDNQRQQFYASSLDGLFGPQTQAGLKRWQRAAGYEPAGAIYPGSRQWNQLRREATVSRLPAGIDQRAVAGARQYGWSVDASKRTDMLYLLRYTPSTKLVTVALSTPTSFGGCNGDGCFVTPNGAFHVCRKAGRWEVSHEWADAEGNPAPMPYAVYMYIGGRCSGTAVHYDPLGNSHQCVHVPVMSEAAYINREMPLGALIVIHG